MQLAAIWNRASKLAVNAARAGSLHLSCPLTNLKIVLTHNRNDSDVKRGNKLVNMKSREVAMKNVQSYRAMGLICRQRAVFDPEHSWKHLGDAEKWEHLAHAEIADHFRECNSMNSAELAPSDASPIPKHETTAAA
jgi:hypothetical protein